jgi:hypothetical protein
MAKVLARPFEPTSLPEDKKSQPVRYFAAVGVVAVVLQAYVLTEWLVHGPTRTPNGPTPVPHSLDVSVVIVQGLCVGGLAAFFYFAVVRPLRRDHRLHWDGYLFFGFCLMAWGDPGGNMFRVWFTYPTNFVQFGSWLNYMPFVRLPHAGRFPEPLVSTYTGYVWYNFIGVLLGCKVMQKSRDRWGLGRSGQLWCGFLFLVCLDLIMEEICLRLNWYQYHETIGPVLDRGKPYMLPVIEGFLWGGLMFAVAVVRYIRDDKGQSLVERGLDQLQISTRRKNWVRLLALAGFVNICILGYALAGSFVALAGTPYWPQAQKSYLDDGFCGPGTDTACPSNNVPVPLNSHSIYIDPSGRPVYPPGNTFGAPGK